MVTLQLSRYRFSFAALESAQVPIFAGSAWRGAFGTALKRTVCVTRQSECDGCPLIGSCCFPYLFEGRRPESVPALRSQERIPVPYSLHFSPTADRRILPGQMVSIDLGLVGRANDGLIYVVHALARAAAGGVGPGRGRYELQTVERIDALDDDAGEPVYASGRFLRADGPRMPPLILNGYRKLLVELATPLRLKRDGHLVTPESFGPAALADAAVRRISALAAFHSGTAIDADFRDLKLRALSLSMEEAELRWEDWKRRSSRQDQTMAMGGLLGRFILNVPEEAAALLDWLDLGQWVGVGKGASMGLGQIRLRPVEADA